MNKSQIYISSSQGTNRHAVNLNERDFDAPHTSRVIPLLSMEELRNLNFEPPHDWTYFFGPPKEAFDAREFGEVDTPDGWQTLQTFLTDADYRSIAANILLEVKPAYLPKPDTLITIYRVINSESSSDYGAILPGAAVSESFAHAHLFAGLHADKKCNFHSSEVYPDELITRGNPHEFIYIPRSLKDGFARYLADIKRQRDIELRGAGQN